MSRKNRTVFASVLTCLLVASSALSASAGAVTPQRSYRITMPGVTSGLVNERSGPGTSYRIVGTLKDGATIEIACQTSGTDIFGTKVWDQISPRAYVTNYYTTTSQRDRFSPTIPRCASTEATAAPTTTTPTTTTTTSTTTTTTTTTTTLPPATATTSATTYVITMPGSTSGVVNERLGPGTNYPVVGTLEDGSSITIACQTSGTDIFGTTVWDQLTSGVYVTDYYTDSVAVDGTTITIPQCAPPVATPPVVVGDATLGQTTSSNPFVEDDYCTWYAEVRFHDFVSKYPALYPAGHTYIDVSGNAYQWEASAMANGWTVTSTPTVDSIAVIQPGWDDVLTPDGHVGWVTAVGANGTFTLAELNEDLSDGQPNTSYQPDLDPNYRVGAGVSFILIPT